MIISDDLIADVSGTNSQGAVYSNGFTYSGHPVSAAAALTNIESEGILEHVRNVTPHFEERLASLGTLLLVSDTRGMGLVGCVECVADAGSKNVLELDKSVGAMIDAHCQENGLILRPLINMCVFSPPLIISESEINQMFDILEMGIRLTTEDLAQQGIIVG